MFNVSKKTVLTCISVGIVLGFMCFKHDWTSFAANLHTTSCSTKRDVDVADLFVYPGRKYNINDGVTYDCFTGLVKQKYGIIYNTVDVIPERRETGIVDTNREKEFQKIFDQQLWVQQSQRGKVKDVMASNYQASGHGSTLEYGQTPLALLNTVIERLKTHLNKPVISIVDVPCGDLFWMKELLGRRADVRYTGMDIVPTLIERHKKNYGSMAHAQFKHMDIVKHKLDEPYDIIFSRDMLQHLPYADVMQVLEHFSSSGSTLLLTTQYRDTVNKDIKAGEHRHLDLLLPPIGLTPPICEISDSLNGVKWLAVWKLPLKLHKPRV